MVCDDVLGHHRNIEIVVYGKDSIFAKNQILKSSRDPLARLTAAPELLELINAVIVSVPQPEVLKMRMIANGTANATTASALASAGILVDTS